jgi:hypothetical protein
VSSSSWRGLTPATSTPITFSEPLCETIGRTRHDLEANTSGHATRTRRSIKD